MRLASFRAFRDELEKIAIAGRAKAVLGLTEGAVNALRPPVRLPTPVQRPKLSVPGPEMLAALRRGQNLTPATFGAR